MSEVKATSVASHLLDIAKKQNVPLAPLKLIKLVYLCEGWSLALRDKSLIREEVEAWQYGPVIPDLYKKIREFRAAPVTHIAGPAETLNADQKSLIKSVFDAYKHLTGIQLSDLTHQPGTPWSKAYKPKRKGIVIPTSDIKTHFTELNRAKG